MKYCSKCDVNIAASREDCPLCQAPLEPMLNAGANAGGEDVFPHIPTIYRQYNLFFRILIFISVVISVAAFFVNLMLPQTGWWCLFVIAGVLCVWANVATIIRKRRNIQKALLYQVVILSGMGVLWDLMTGWHGWSIEYVIPCVCVAAMVALAILYKVLKVPISAYLLYFDVVSLFGIIPIVFYLTGALDVYIPSLVCVACSLISLAALIVFAGDSMLAELRRRFHL